MASDIPLATQYQDLVSANPNIRAKIWSKLVLRDARSRNVFKQFIGSEKQGLPIVEKRDLSKGGSDTVTFTTTAPIRNQGVLGETELKSVTDKLRFGTFPVQVDLLRHAVGWTQVLKLLRFTGQTIDQLSASLMGEWLGRKEEDDMQKALLRTARLIDTSGRTLMRIGGGASAADLVSADTMTTTIIEEAKSRLISQGGQPLRIDQDSSGAFIPQYLFFAPNNFLNPLRGSSVYLQALREADMRGKDNSLFTGKYAHWDNMIMFPHNIVIDTADGRQGSPLEPRAYLGTALADAVPTTITGGGTANPAGTTGDYFANFPGYLWKYTLDDTPPTDSGTHYAIIYNLTGGNKDKAEGISYTTGNNGNTITGVTREVNSVVATAGGAYANDHPSGSLIIPCTVNGVPIGYGIVMGDTALCYAKGMVDAERIEHWDDFKAVGSGRPHLKAVGMQSVRGMAAYQDTNGNFPNFVVVQGALPVKDAPGLAAYAP